MKRIFHSSYCKRVPRKLKKAAKYGVKHLVFPNNKIFNTNPGNEYLRHEKTHVWIIIGRRTKYKIKACYKCESEYRQSIKELKEKWFREAVEDRIVMFKEQRGAYVSPSFRMLDNNKSRA